MLETLEQVPQLGRYLHLLRGINDLTSPVGREPITNMSHLVVITPCALFLNWSVMRVRGRDVRCIDVVS